MTSDQPPLLNRAEMAVVRRDFGEGEIGCYGDGMATLALRLSPISPAALFFPFSSFNSTSSSPAQSGSFFSVIYPKGSYFTDFIS